MTPGQLILKRRVLGEPADRLASELVLERVPYIFADDWSLFREWRRALARNLEVDSCDVIITGSAAVGHSLSPYKNLKEFDDQSDIDISIVSPHHFDVAWRVIREIKQTQVSDRVWQSVQSHIRNYIFWGCIACDQLLPVLPFAARWRSALQRMAEEDPTQDRVINARIYRDFHSIRAYQIRSLESLRAELS